MAQNPQQKQQEVASRFAQLMIERMEAMQGQQWTQGWIGSPGKATGMPRNIAGRSYSGSNSFFLQLLTAQGGYTTPVFLTFNQAHNLGAHVLKGQKAWPVIYWDMLIKDKFGNKIAYSDYKEMSQEQRKELTTIPFIKTYPVYNIDQTNLREANPKKYAEILAGYQIQQLRDASGMYSCPSLDRMVERQEWLCPIKANELSPRAYYSTLRDIVVVPNKEQFNLGGTSEETFVAGQQFYSTMLHEMTHSTLTPARLNRDGGKRFGDEKYANEELVAELTAAMVGNSLGFDRRIGDHSAKYLSAWISTLREQPQFILSVMADVNKASDLVISHIDKQRLAIGEAPLNEKNRPAAAEEAQIHATLIKTQSGQCMLRAECGDHCSELRPISAEQADFAFKLTDSRERSQYISSLADKTFGKDLDTLREKASRTTSLSR